MEGRAWRWLLLVVVVLGSCRDCGTSVQGVRPGDVRVSPAELSFGRTWIGDHAVRILEVQNTSTAELELPLLVRRPFAAQTQLTLAGGEVARVSVEFSPDSADQFDGAISVGPVTVPLSGTGVPVPDCGTGDVCTPVSFDFARAACVAKPLADGTQCSNGCIEAGQCVSGACLGTSIRCDDSDPCTVDSCAPETDCFHEPLVCDVPADPCRASACDAQLGCVVTAAPDGTLCGPDDCTKLSVDICLNGACVTRSRPESGQCRNTWLAVLPPARYGPALAWDGAHQRVVLFGGSNLSDTWEWDGAIWRERRPAASPAGRTGHAMAWDAARRRVLLFGGLVAGLPANDLWSWDGTTWARLVGAYSSPSAREGHAMAYDAARGRVVLFGGFDGALRGDTWEWNGLAWTKRALARSPPPRRGHAMAWDGSRRRVVLFGGADAAGVALSDTWEWDGVTWTQRAPPVSPPAVAEHAMAWDEVRAKVVLFGGNSGGPIESTWEWDGMSWTERVATGPGPRRRHALAWDGVNRTLMLFGGIKTAAWPLGDAWTWNGAEWALQPQSAAPPGQLRVAVAWDTNRRRAVLVGGATSAAVPDVWEWNGQWVSVPTAAAPGASLAHMLAFDEARNVTVYVGLHGLQIVDTWTWNGVAWQRQPDSGPIALEASLAWDPNSRRLILFAQVPSRTNPPVATFETWAWDGTAWSKVSSTTTPVVLGTIGPMTLDRARGRVVLPALWLTGGADAARTYEWDGAAWTEIAPATRPPYRSNYGLAWNATTGRVTLFGGIRGGQQLADTWEWDGRDWAQRWTSAAPPPRAGPALFYDATLGRLVLFGGHTNSYLSDTWQLLP